MPYRLWPREHSGAYSPKCVEGLFSEVRLQDLA
jgi:hypothetical protein